MKKGERVSLLCKEAFLEGLGLPAGTVQATLVLTLEQLHRVEKVTGGVTKKVLEAGSGYEKPNEGAQVTLRFSAALAGSPGTRVVPESEVTELADDEALCPGLDKAVLQMGKGEVAVVVVPPAFGYPPAQAAALGVPPEATLVFSVTLLDFTKDKESWDLKDGAEKLAYAEAKKAAGNALFAEGQASRAGKRYAKGIKMLEHDSAWADAEQKASKALKAALHSNAAACALKGKDYAAAAAAAAKALACDSTALKARFRHAVALAGLGELMEAARELGRILEAEPGHAEAARELVRVKAAQKAQDDKDKRMFGRMFAPRPAAQPAPADPAPAEPAPMAA
jgi:hypothetical protein